MPTNTKYDNCFKELKDFLFYMLTIRGRSARTVDAYYIDLRTFFRYMLSQKSPVHADANLDEIDISAYDSDQLAAITLSDVYAFLNYTLSDRANAANTRARKVSSIRAFFKYLTVTAAVLQDNPVKNLEVPSVRKTLPKYLTLEESLELLTSISTKHTERDYCIITLLINCGMRLSELVGINLHDIRSDTIKLLGKGNKERIVYLNDACIHALEQYLPARHELSTPKERNALFISRNGRRLTPRRVEQIVGECLQGAGLSGKGYSPHKLRHTAATLMYQHGKVDIRVLKELLGHANLSTTEIYTHVSNAQLEQAADRSPLARVMIDKKITNKEKGNDED